MKKFTFSVLLILGLFVMTANAQDIVPVATFDFKEGPAGWQAIQMSDQTSANGFIYNETNYWEVPAGNWYSKGDKNFKRHTWIVSPVIDLTDVTKTELYLTYAFLYGTAVVQMQLYIQEDANLDLTLTDPTEFLTQWGDMHTDMDSKENGALCGDFSNAKAPINTTCAQNMSMHDGKKVRIGIRLVTPEVDTGSSRNLGVSMVSITGEVFDETPPITNVTAIDSIGNTFARAWITSNEISKIYWAVKAQGETVANLTEIKDNLGSDAFVSSGTLDFNIPNSNVAFEIADLVINSDYTLFYGAEDFKNNESDILTVDFSSDNDLVAPVISTLTIDAISEISAIAHVSADEVGEIMLRVYESGWEPTSYEQFENGQGSFVNVNAYKVNDFSVPADTLLQYLEPDNTYIVYGTVTDLTGNISEIFKSEYFTTLADSKVPVITSASIANITNHGGELTIVCDEPAAGFGDVIGHWVATTQGTVLTSAQVLSRENGLASGTLALDSATYDNLLMLDNLEKNTAYTIHCIAVDASDNASDVTAIDMTTTNDLEPTPIYIQEFDVENLGYHFANVTLPEGANGWTSQASNSRVLVENNVQIRDEFHDAWCVVGPINLTGVLDIAAAWEGELKYGTSYNDKISLWITDNYAGDGVIDINNWTQLSQPGDFTNSTEVQSVERAVPAEYAKAGVYFAFRYYHDVWSHSWYINWLKLYGSRVTPPPAPIIDWVEASQPTSTSVNMMFAANAYGRAYWYLAEEDGAVPDAPTMDQVKSGALASAHGSIEYTAGNYIEQNFRLSGLKPNTKYHLYTAFRDLEYNWATELFYDSEVTVFTTSSLELISASEEVVFATGASLKMAAMSEGRLYWTVKESSEPAPTTFDEIYASFDTKGAFNYTVIDQSEMSWYVNKLMPETQYTAYLIMTESNREYYSAIQTIDFSTPALAVTQASHEAPVLMVGETDLYSVTFNAQTSASGWIHLVMTDKGASEPAIEDILDVSAGFGGQKFSFDDPSDVIIQIENLTKAQSDNFTAWLVVTSSEYISPVYQLDSSIPSAIGDPQEKVDLISIRNATSGIEIIYSGKGYAQLMAVNIVGQTAGNYQIETGVNHVTGLQKGMYIFTFLIDGERISKKVIIK